MLIVVCNRCRKEKPTENDSYERQKWDGGQESVSIGEELFQLCGECGPLLWKFMSGAQLEIANAEFCSGIRPSVLAR